MPRGVLRLAFQPAYINYDRLFDRNGDPFPLGSFFTTDSLGSAFFPTLAPAEVAARTLAGDPAFRFNAGALRGRLDADIRRFPFSAALGITRRLTFIATVPLVTTRVNSTVRVDSTGGNAGWNQVTGPAALDGALDSVTTLLNDLEAAAASLETSIAAGAFGCPASAQCDAARGLVTRARAVAAQISALSGVPGLVSGGIAPAPPFAPLASSAAGQAITAAIASLNPELAAFGITALTGSLPLPATGVGQDAVDQVLAGSEFGYGLSPLTPPETVKLSGFGDIELGLRFGLADGAAARVVLGALARLPTGKRDDPANALDLPTGDRQLDLEWTLDAALEPGSRLGLWLGAAYTLQLADQLTRRVTPPDRPLALPSSEAVVDRNLGDILRVSVHPALRLAPTFRVFVSAAYFRKGADRYSIGGAPVAELDSLTAMSTWSFGAGMLFRNDRGRPGTLPIEASLHYNAAYYGRGGLTPKTGNVNLAIRLFYRLWGGTGTPAPTTGPEPGS